MARVLLATDLSYTSEAARREAVGLCAALGASLVIVNVIDGRRSLGRQLLPHGRPIRIDELRRDRERTLLSFVQDAAAAGVDASFLLWTGEPGEGIVSAAEAERADLVVLGTRALDRAGRFLLGSVSDYVVNHSPCPVLVARATEAAYELTPAASSQGSARQPSTEDVRDAAPPDSIVRTHAIATARREIHLGERGRFLGDVAGPRQVDVQVRPEL